MSRKELREKRKKMRRKAMIRLQIITVVSTVVIMGVLLSGVNLYAENKDFNENKSVLALERAKELKGLGFSMEDTRNTILKEFKGVGCSVNNEESMLFISNELPNGAWERQGYVQY